jgi:UDP-3-O-[3-hydroxymyristoyl] glucosamine N-acyltransferase
MMADQRFFCVKGPIAVGDIAKFVGAELTAPQRASELIYDIANLEQARAGEISVFFNSRHASAYAGSHASVVIVSPKLRNYPHNGAALLLSEEPRLAFARAAKLFYPRLQASGAIAASAHIAPTASVGDQSSIGPGAVIGEHAVIGQSCIIEANVVIGAGVTVGSSTHIGANSSISHAIIGDRVSIASNVSIGGEGFGFVQDTSGPLRICQVGRVIVGDDVDIGNNCAIDRGCLGDTVIGAKTVIDNLVQIGHNVQIGRNCVLAGQSGVAGSTVIGDFVMIGGAVSISDHLAIGAGAKIAGKSGVMRDVLAGQTVAGYPAVPVRQWHRQNALQARAIKSGHS